MLFRSLFFVAPLLVASEVCEGDCDASEQTAMLQLKGRDQTVVAKELLQRSADASQHTLKTLEENLLLKDGGLDTAKCEYHLKSAMGMPPCQRLDLLERTFKEAMKDFKEFDQIAKKTMTNIMDLLTESLANLPAVATNFTIGLTDEGFEIKKLTEAIGDALREMGSSPDATTFVSPIAAEMHGALSTLGDELQAALSGTVAEVEANVKAVLAGEDVTLSDGVSFSPSMLIEDFQSGNQDALNEAMAMVFGYLTERFAIFMNLVGQHWGQFWKTMLHFPATVEDPLAGIEWSDAKDVKKVEKLFWHLARGYVDDVEAVESACKSESFDSRKPNQFAVKKICTNKSPPSCVGALLYSSADTTAVCDVVKAMPRRIRAKAFDDGNFKSYCEEKSDCQEHMDAVLSLYPCKTSNDLHKACQMMQRAEAKKEKEARKQAKRRR